MTALVRYDAACRALAEAKAVDEVKDVRDKAVAMAAYARQAKNRDLEADAVDIRMRAERRLGEMLVEQKATVGLNQGAKGSKVTGAVREPVKDERPTLASQGIDKKLSSRAQKLAAMPHDRFEQAVAETRDAVTRAVNNVVNQDDKAERRADRERELGAMQRALPTMKYGVIYADPPWKFEPYSIKTGMDRAADNHYPTMTLEDIKALPVSAADDAVLFLWATAPMLVEAIMVMQAWGFEYKTNLVWGKDRIGTGYWARNKHELLLIGTRGNVPAPAPGTQPDSLIMAPLGEHSAKPFKFREMIEEMFPTMPRIELFAREAFEGWDVWGYEAPVGG